MRVTRVFVVFLCVGALACGSGGVRPTNVPQPEVSVRAVGTLFFGSLRQAPLEVQTLVTNRANVPITVRSVRLAAPGMVQWTIRPISQSFNQTLSPGESKTFPIVTTAVASARGLTATEPLSVRADIFFEAEGQSFREIYNYLNVPM